MKPDGIVFDLDGTLWDTNAVCASAWNEVLRRLGITHRAIVEDDVRRVCGLPHREAVHRVFSSLSDLEIERLADETADEDNRAIAARGGFIYPGVKETIPILASRHPLMIVSNCQSGYIEVFLQTSGLAEHFRDHECWGSTRCSKSENLRRVIERNRLERPIFVGDMESDAIAARENSIPFVHARYGFGTVASEQSLDDFRDLLSRW